MVLAKLLDCGAIFYMRLGKPPRRRVCFRQSEIRKWTRLTVNLSVKFSRGRRKPVKVDVKISFPVEKVKENLEDEVDELQLSMFSACSLVGEMDRKRWRSLKEGYTQEEGISVSCSNS